MRNRLPPQDGGKKEDDMSEHTAEIIDLRDRVAELNRAQESTETDREDEPLVPRAAPMQKPDGHFATIRLPIRNGVPYLPPENFRCIVGRYPTLREKRGIIQFGRAHADIGCEYRDEWGRTQWYSLATFDHEVDLKTEGKNIREVRLRGPCRMSQGQDPDIERTKRAIEDLRAKLGSSGAQDEALEQAIADLEESLQAKEEETRFYPVLNVQNLRERIALHVLKAIKQKTTVPIRELYQANRGYRVTYILPVHSVESRAQGVD